MYLNAYSTGKDLPFITKATNGKDYVSGSGSRTGTSYLTPNKRLMVTAACFAIGTTILITFCLLLLSRYFRKKRENYPGEDHWIAFNNVGGMKKNKFDDAECTFVPGQAYTASQPYSATKKDEITIKKGDILVIERIYIGMYNPDNIYFGLFLLLSVSSHFFFFYIF